MGKELTWHSFEDHLLNEGVTALRVKKLRAMYNLVTRGLRRPLSECTREDVEEFCTRMNRDQFRRKDGSSLSGSTKSDAKKFLKQWFKWAKGDNEFYPAEVSWLRTRIRKDELPLEKAVLTVQEVRDLARSFRRPALGILTLLLFDSGFRIREMLSVRKRDLTWEEFDEQGNKCFWISCNSSKTEKRKVDVPLFTEDIRLFASSSSYTSLSRDAHLISVSYSNYYRLLGDHSRVCLGKKISPHALRHSSATHYARVYGGNMLLLTNRYGWTYSSKQLQTYIRRSGAYQREGAKRVFTNEIVRLRSENERIKEQLASLTERFEAVVGELSKRVVESGEAADVMKRVRSPEAMEEDDHR